jgi:hypothetical protein
MLPPWEKACFSVLSPQRKAYVSASPLGEGMLQHAFSPEKGIRVRFPLGGRHTCPLPPWGKGLKHKENQKGHHQGEEGDGFRQGEPQNGIAKELLR